MEFRFAAPIKIIRVHSEPQIITDQLILSQIEEGNMQGWSNLYDKYSPMMYGIIYKLAPNKSLCEEIFTKAFMQWKEKKNFSTKENTLWLSLFRHTYNLTVAELIKRKIIPVEHDQVEESEVLALLSSDHYTLSEVAYIFRISEEEVTKKLRLEFLALRNKSSNEKQPKTVSINKQVEELKNFQAQLLQ